MEIIDWQPRNDSFLKEGEIQIHEAYHEALGDGEIDLRVILDGPKRKTRKRALALALNQIQEKIHGKVLEVGAGDGWCSCHLLLDHNPEEVHVMEINRPAIESLIPKVLTKAGADLEKVRMIHGSFNAIHHKHFYDFVIAMGALHHSSHLLNTFKEIFASLKPGGWLIAQEPYMTDETQNDYFIQRQGQVVNFKGLQEISNADRSDIFYRLCEYRTAAFHAGFRFQYRNIRPRTMHDLLMQMKNFRKTRPQNMVMMLQKPINEELYNAPTKWE